VVVEYVRFGAFLLLTLVVLEIEKEDKLETFGRCDRKRCDDDDTLTNAPVLKGYFRETD